ncbi:hypothetical protein VB715_18840 [Crocosphaera sp. UHCC 0190]|uniref:hypothetical protein n=1 Tax=Crocosphaera sp. UHCC 0190 TaxID=3110246 RepID=UPI002B1F126A|nr:hypothetical protein [Crocosphaera sp. UHCC 0190]MEA5511833.1 hypothetical protein [Crocosphaera sp. UHCC 0190]
MKIRCLAKTGLSLPETYLKPEFSYTKELEFPLTVGQEYIVYALKEWQGNIWYYICDDNYTYYPRQHPAPLFEVIDNHLSSYWRFKCYPNGLIRIAFEEWLTEPYFYDKLTDQEDAEVLIFETIKQLIDNEKYPHQPFFDNRDKIEHLINNPLKVEQVI